MAEGELATNDVDPATTKRAFKSSQKAKTRQSNSVERVIADFIALYAKPNTRDWKETQRLLKQFADNGKAASSRKSLRAISIAFLTASLPGAPRVGANRAFAQLRKMCKWAVSRGIIERSPCEGIDPPSAEKSRDRVLNLDELRLVWRAADDLGFPFGPIVKLLILTGQRRSEVGGMEWAELDPEGAFEKPSSAHLATFPTSLGRGQ